MKSGAVRHAAPHKVDKLGNLFDVIEQLSPTSKNGVSYLEHSSDDQSDTRALFFHDTKSTGHRALFLIETEWDEVTAIVPPAPNTQLERIVNGMIGEFLATRQMGQIGLRSMWKYTLDTPFRAAATVTREYEIQLISKQGNVEYSHDSVRFDGSVDSSLSPKGGIRMAANALSVIDEEEFERIEQVIARLGER